MLLQKICPPNNIHWKQKNLGNKITCIILVSGGKAFFFCNPCMYSLACGLLKHFALMAAVFCVFFLKIQHQWVNRLVDSIKAAGTGNEQGTISKFVWVKKDMKVKLLQQKVVVGHMQFTGFCPNQAKGVDMDNIPVLPRVSCSTVSQLVWIYINQRRVSTLPCLCPLFSGIAKKSPWKKSWHPWHASKVFCHVHHNDVHWHDGSTTSSPVDLALHIHPWRSNRESRGSWNERYQPEGFFTYLKCGNASKVFEKFCIKFDVWFPPHFMIFLGKQPNKIHTYHLGCFPPVSSMSQSPPGWHETSLGILNYHFATGILGGGTCLTHQGV